MKAHSMQAKFFVSLLNLIKYDAHSTHLLFCRDV